MLKLRVVTALILAAALLAVLFILPFDAFVIAVGAVYLIGSWEWGRMMTRYATHRYEYLALAICLLIWLYGYTYIYMSNGFYLWPSELWPALEPTSLTNLLVYSSLPFWGLSTIGLVYYQATQKAFLNGAVAQIIAGILILTPLLICLICLRLIGLSEGDTVKGSLFILYAFAIVAGADIGAYAAGKTFGKNKLAPHISPGKTWEGVFGGVVGAQLVAYIGAIYLVNLNITGYMSFSLFVLILSFVSVVGDLFISLQKRQKGIKDSSNLLPGHGGALDRLDSLAAAIPLFYIGLSWLGYI